MQFVDDNAIPKYTIKWVQLYSWINLKRKIILYAKMKFIKFYTFRTV